jgi:hypothetical protein
MAITGNPGDLATGGFGTGVRGVAATPRDVANAVSRGEAMAGARMGGGGQGNNRAGPLSVYGNEFTFTDEELKNAALSGAGLLFGTPQNPSIGMLMDMQKQVNANPQLKGVLNAIQAPFKAGYQAPSGLLDSAVSTATAPSGSFQGFGLPDVDLNNPLASGMLATQNNEFYSSLPSIAPMMGVAPTDKLAAYMGNPTMTTGPRVGSAMPQGILQQQDMGPLSDAAVSAALGYQNTPLENDIAYLASRVGPSASPEALALVEPTFVTELARELRKAEEATGTTARINDLYRSPDTQGELYTRLKAQDPNYMVAPAGSSWHQGAIAADIARSPVLNYMRANTPSTLNFPYGQNDLVHVQLSDPEIAALGYQMNANKFDKSPLRAFTSTMGDGGFMLAGGDFGQMSPVSVAAAPSPAPVRAVMPQQPTNVAFNQPLAPRTPTPTVIDRIATSVLGIPGYDTGPGLLSGAAKAGEYGSQMLAASQPQGVEPAAVTAPPVNRPTAAPTSLASLLFERGMERRGEGRRRKRKSTTTEQMQSDTIGGLLA